MPRIDNETVRKILDTANIVDVVSDFVNLKRSGSGYKGLCPFHNERTPSFSVSPARNMCKCFSCGKGGSPVGFMMELEQMSYVEALRYLANKYNIPVQEHELTEEERQQATRRESMFAVNEFANKHFRHNLTDTPDGRDIGLAYFRHRGLSDAMIERFGLGYALDKRDDLLRAARAAGYDNEWLVATGLCSSNERGVYDRFRGRVTYPVYSVSGKVVAFGARTLRSDKTIAKYVNSPESEIYHKSRELYGLYQAKKSIVANDKCILVEGYMDVISMHQAGVENVVASSGTSLTEEQIRLIHRFTDNVTVIYDSDPAGIKASMRGIDMLLAERLNIKVLLLPDGDDPDSFARSRTHDEVMRYIAENETDFIQFKTRILLDDAKSDPQLRSRVIGDIVRSIAHVFNEITRTLYIQQCADTFRIPEAVLTRQVAAAIRDIKQQTKRPTTQQLSSQGSQQPSADYPEPEPPLDDHSGETPQPQTPQPATVSTDTAGSEDGEATFLREAEIELLRLILRFGMTRLTDFAQNGEEAPTVLQVISQELAGNGIALANADIRDSYTAAIQLAETSWSEDLMRHIAEVEQRAATMRADGEAEIRDTAEDMAHIKQLTTALDMRIVEERSRLDDEFRDNYIAHFMLSHPDSAIRQLAEELIPQKYQLSRIHSRHAHIESERDKLNDNVPKAVYTYQYQILMFRIKQLQDRLRGCTDTDELREIFSQLSAYNELKKEFATYLGERVLAAKL